MLTKLAIIIPAYKAAYLDRTLDSLSQQTDKEFSIYIGDDNSPYDLGNIISKYSGQLDITYKRFTNNLGSQNLVQQWNRCLDMIRGEEFFCLFSDDDIMEPTCIEQFRKTYQQDKNFDVFHFDIDIIDGNDTVIKSCNNYPSVLSIDEYLRLLYTYQIDARIHF